MRSHSTLNRGRIMNKFLIAIVVILILHVKSSHCKCSFTARDDYQNNTMGGNPPQPYNGDPFVLSDDYYARLAKYCPHITTGSQVCCNTTQVDKLLKNMMRIEVTLWHCSACMNNFKRMWCDFTCSPDQSDFVDVKEVYPAPYDNYVQSVSFKVNGNWSENMWNSCKDNQMGAGPVWKQFPTIQNFLQGILTADPPKPMVWFQFGTIEQNDFGYHGEVIPCENSCVCEYCEAVCRNGKQVEPDFTCRVGNASCLKFGIIVLSISSFLFVVAVMVAAAQRLITYFRSPARKSKSEESNYLFTVNSVSTQ